MTPHEIFLSSHPKSKLPDGFLENAKGKQAKELAASYGDCVRTINNWQRQCGLPTNGWTVDYALIDKLTDEGKSTKEIVAITGFSKSAIDRQKRSRGKGSGIVKVHRENEIHTAEPVYPFATLYRRMLRHKAREMGLTLDQLKEKWVGGVAWRQAVSEMTMIGGQ